MSAVTSVVVWTAGGLLIGLLSPPLLRLGMRRGVDAGVLLITWANLVSLTVIAIALPAVSALVHGCWLALGVELPWWVDVLVGLLSGAAVVIAIIGGGWQIAGVTRHRRRVHARHTELAWLLTGTAPQAGRVLWLPTSEPHAYSLTGSPPLVVMSLGLRDCLDQAAVSAVRSHEDAHLQRRHHWFIAVAQALSAGIAWLPLTRQSPALVRILIELDADAHAARIHGHRPLRRAIQTLRYAPAPAVSLGIASGSAQLRLERLSVTSFSGTSHGSRSVVPGTALFVATVIVSVALAIGAGLASCAP